MLYAQAVYLLITLFLIFKVIRKDYNLFHVLIFVIPFHSWFYNIGLNLTVFQIVILIMLSWAVFKGRNILYVGNVYIVIFLTFTIIDTIIVSMFFIDDFLNIGGFFRSEGRFLSQLLLLLITFAIIPFAFNYIKNMQDIKKCLKVYLTALIILVAFGWLQYSTYSFTGRDIFPLSVNEFGDIRTGLFGHEGSVMFRMSSLGGEPKGFSMSLIMGFYIIHVFNREGIYFFKYDQLLKYLYLFTAFATLSTSGMVLFLLLFFVYFMYQMSKSNKSIKINSKKLVYALFMFFILMLLVVRYWDFVSLIIEQRIFERNLVGEDYDAVIQQFLFNTPEYILFGSGLGNVHNLAYPYIPHQYIHYMGDSIFVAKSGYLKIISELGLIGISLFFYMAYSVYRKLGKFKNNFNSQNRQVYSAMQLLLVISLMAYFARNYVIGEFFLFFALANVMVYSKAVMKEEVG